MTSAVTTFQPGRVYIGGARMDRSMIVTQRFGTHITARGDATGALRVHMLLDDREMNEIVTGADGTTFVSCDVKEERE